MSLCRRCLIAVTSTGTILMTGCTLTVPSPTDRKPQQIELASPQHVPESLTLAPGDYRAPTADDRGAFVIETDGVVLDFGQARLIGAASVTPPNEYVGRGIVVRDARNVTIRNAIIEGFKVAIYAENAPGLTIEDCDVSRNYRQRLKSTLQREDYADWLQPHANDDNEWLRYGAGVYLLRCDNARIIRNRARDGQNGICLADCDGVRVERNDMSYMSGWGLAMWRSNRCFVQGNRFDYCVRGYSYGVYARGQDSAGILVFEQCCDNLFACNSATHCGDGFFLYAGHETLKETGRGGCNGNILYQNDFSHSVAIGIEATFSENNVFLANRIHDCRYGIWAGYSRHTTIAANVIYDCTIGVAIEHGRENSITANRVDSCDTGIRLWWDKDESLQSLAFCKINDCASIAEGINLNTVCACITGIEADQTSGLGIDSNVIDSCVTSIDIWANTTLQSLEGNAIANGRIVNASKQRVAGRHNSIDSSVELRGDIVLNEPVDAETVKHFVTQSAGQAVEAIRATHQLDAIGRRHRALEVCTPPTPIHQRRWPSGSAPSSPGHDGIFITEWGPFNHESGEPRLYPERVVAWNEATTHVLGRGEKFFMQVVDGDVVASASRGKTPSKIIIRPRDALVLGATPFSIRFDLGKRTLHLEGTVLQASWQVAYYVCPPQLDPRDEGDWQQVLTSPPVHSENRDRLQFNWSNRRPHEEVPVADRFGLVAETRMHLPAGPWRIRTISDDGVRVYMNGERVIDNWTWHIPTEDRAEVLLKDGKHVIRVEYFDLVGEAQLLFDLGPADSEPAAAGAE